jgi:hypothetical protein
MGFLEKISLWPNLELHTSLPFFGEIRFIPFLGPFLSMAEHPHPLGSDKR